MSDELEEVMTTTSHLRPVSGWMRRVVGELLADVKPVDSGSLDVLLYCRDDLAAGARGEWRVPGPVDGP